MAIRPDELELARRTGSIAGYLCQFSGSLLALIGGVSTVAVVAKGGGLAGLLVGGSVTFGLALAGAPIAALGSIANSQKASKELLFLYVQETATADLMWPPSGGAEPVTEGVTGGTATTSQASPQQQPPPPPLPPEIR